MFVSPHRISDSSACLCNGLGEATTVRSDLRSGIPPVKVAESDRVGITRRGMQGTSKK
jgi:hypothetical protein